jgi:hypothetical protein
MVKGGVAAIAGSVTNFRTPPSAKAGQAFAGPNAASLIKGGAGFYPNMS